MHKDKQIELEENFIAACMVGDSFQDLIRNSAKAVDYFTDKDHALIYKIMLESENSGRKFEPVVLANEIRKNNGNESKMFSIYARCSTNANIDYHLNLLRDGYLRRRTRSMMEYSLRSLDCQNTQANDVLTDLQTYITELQEVSIEGVTSHIDTAVQEAHDLMMMKMFNEGGIVGIESGIQAIDYVTRGFEESRVYAVCGRPGGGKTTLTLQMMSNAAKKNNALVFSMEMPKKELVSKIIRAEARIDLRAKSQTEKEDNVLKIASVLEDVIEKQMYINDCDYQTISSLQTEIRRMHRKGMCDIAIIDHATLVQTGKMETREMLSKLFKMLKGLSKELKIPVVVLCQFNKGPEKEQRVGRLSDIGESDTIGQDIDCAIFLHNENYSDPKNQNFQVNIRKNRGGELADIPVTFVKKHQLFEERSWDL